MYQIWWQDLCLLAIASGTMSLVITRSHLTKSMRHAMIGAPLKLDELFNCPWCMGFWTALPAAVAIGGPVGAIIINWLIITGLSGLYMGLMMKLWLFREDELESMRELLREARESINTQREVEQTLWDKLEVEREHGK